MGYKCNKCDWRSEAYAYEGDCEYGVFNKDKQPRFRNKERVREINDWFNKEVIELEKTRNLMLKEIEEECDDGC